MTLYDIETDKASNTGLIKFGELFESKYVFNPTPANAPIYFNAFKFLLVLL